MRKHLPAVVVSPQFLPSLFIAVNLMLAAVYCIVFFVTLDGLPDTVPLHYTNGVGFDRWGDKSELRFLGIFPGVLAVLNTIVSALLIRWKTNWLAYLSNGFMLFISLVMALVAALMLRGAM